MITATYQLNLHRDDRDADRRAVTMLYGMPVGSRVILEVGARRSVSSEIALFREYAPTLHLEVYGEPAAVAAWVEALHGRGPWGDL